VSAGATVPEPATPLRLEAGRCPNGHGEPTRLVRRSRSWLDEVPGAFEVRACSVCGLWVTSPRPAAESLATVYPPGYHKVRLANPGQTMAVTAPDRGLLLDVGCGVGDAMASAAAEGWRCRGIEISPQAAEVARGRGFETIVGDALTVEFPSERFDRVLCWHTLEHVSDPLGLLGRLRGAVREGGHISVLVPNRRSVLAVMFRRCWYHLDLPRHLFHFRPADIRALASQAGLEVRAERHKASPSGLLGSVDCLTAAWGRTRTTSLRRSPRLRSATRAVTWPIARVGLADVVEYELVPS
jgi:SAM-dependent methyltransferase